MIKRDYMTRLIIFLFGISLTPMSLADDALDKYKRNAILDTIQSAGPSIRNAYGKKGFEGEALDSKVEEVARVMIDCQIQIMTGVGDKYLRVAIEENGKGTSIRESVNKFVLAVKNDAKKGVQGADQAREKLQTYNSDVATCTKDKLNKS